MSCVSTSKSVGKAKATLGAYQDGYTIGIKNGESYTAVSGSYGASLEINNKTSIGISHSYEHRFETNDKRDTDEHTAFSAPWDIYGCPRTVIDTDSFVLDDSSNTISSDDFWGFSGDYHFIVGGHYVIGWDVSRFNEILLE